MLLDFNVTINSSMRREEGGYFKKAKGKKKKENKNEKNLITWLYLQNDIMIFNHVD